ncbi:cytochrome P450 2J4-like, partial [Oppia nitens]|uniref:cytochrome P450 2J4-like n=1 Tax=Oppia nitens TaxID=1686743 RepID=UPI0023DBE4D6
YLLISKIYKDYKVLNKLPPGPWSLPLIGNLNVFTNLTSKTFVDWSKKYGPIIGLQLGSSPTVVLNDWPSIKDALSQESVLARPKDNAFNTFTEESFVSMSGQQWKDQRRFALHQLRDLGFGKTSMEDHIIDEINHLCEELIDKSLGIEINVREVLAITVSNNVSAFLFGRRLDYSDKRKKLIDDLVKPNPTFSLTSVLAHDEFKLHKKTLNSNDFRDYIDAFLTELKKPNPKTSFNMKMLSGNVFNLFGAGTATTTLTLEWALVLLATYPDIQLKIFTEIDDTIGRDKTPQYAHRNQMPYLQAFIHEVMRFRSIVTINLPRCTSADTVINGHQIAKGTQILVNLWAIDNDPKLWDNPQVFRPERYLKDNGTVFFKPEHFIPFSYGKRSCPGEAMGTAEVFLYIASLVQRYDIKATKNTDTTLEYELLFRQLSHISQHKRIHFGERPYSCDVNDCDKRFRQQSGLDQHKRIHFDQKPYKCNVDDCNQQFRQKSNLDQHKRIHFNEKPYKCDVINCNKEYRQKKSLDQHKCVHLK